jgi:hypothetical protein
MSNEVLRLFNLFLLAIVCALFFILWGSIRYDANQNKRIENLERINGLALD